MINCVSPAYLKTHGEPTKIEELAKHFIIYYATVLGARSASWEYFDGEKYAALKIKSLITVNSSDTYTVACLEGLGIIQVPLAGLKHYIEDGRLLEILRNYKAEPMPVSLLYPNRKNQPKRVKVFMDWITEVMQEYIE